MSQSFASLFRKTSGCPTSQVLLAYSGSLLNSSELAYIDRHLAVCDFCSAELQLLTRYCGEAEEYSSAEMPAQLRRLAEDLLGGSSAPCKGFAALAETRQLFH